MDLVDIVPKDIEIVISITSDELRTLLDAFDTMTMNYDGKNINHTKYKETYQKFYSMLEKIEKGLKNGD